MACIPTVDVAPVGVSNRGVSRWPPGDRHRSSHLVGEPAQVGSYLVRLTPRRPAIASRGHPRLVQLAELGGGRGRPRGTHPPDGFVEPAGYCCSRPSGDVVDACVLGQPAGKELGGQPFLVEKAVDAWAVHTAPPLGDGPRWNAAERSAQGLKWLRGSATSWHPRRYLAMGRNEFEGKKVRLRAVEPDDAEIWYASALDTDLDRWADQTHVPYSHAVYRQRVEEVSKRPEDDSAVLMIETLHGVTVGGLSVQTPNRRAGVFSFGIGIAPDHWRKGYATEALELLFRFYFTELRYQKVESGVYAFNEPSLRFHEAFGFVVEGRRRRSVFTRGEYHDVVFIGMTAEEFAERHPV